MTDQDVRRLVVEPGFAVETFFTRAYDQDWDWIKTIEESEAGPREAIFMTGDRRTAFHFVEDSFLDTKFVLVRGDEVERWMGVVRALVPHRTDAEILATARTGGTIEERVRGLLDLAVVAGQLDRREVLATIEHAIGANETVLRRASLLVVSYLGWRELRSLAERMAADDPDEEVRSEAEVVVEGYELHGGEGR